MGIPVMSSMYPRIALYRQGALVRELDCVPVENGVATWGVYLVEKPIELEGADAVVIAFDGGDLRRTYDRADVARAEASAGSIEDPARQSDPAALERLAEKLDVSYDDLCRASATAGVVMHCFGAATHLRMGV